MGETCLICGKKQNEEEQGLYHKKCTLRLFGSESVPHLPYSLDNLDKLALSLIKTNSATLTGVQKKLSMGLSHRKDGRKGQLTLIGVWGNYILKPPVEEYRQLPENEQLTMNLADTLGINTVPHGLIPLQSGELSYITRRIDRTGAKSKEKTAMEDFCQLTERMTEDKYRGSLEQAGKIILKHCTNRGYDSLRFYELVLFCFLTGNGDMHLKNFSLITGERGITFAPAYDLLNTRLVIPENLDREESALTLNGRKRKLGWVDFYSLAEKLEMTEKQRENVFKRFIKKKEALIQMINQSHLERDLIDEYIRIFLSRWQRIFPNNS